ncbi:MAG TPA: PKD domain-containing protein [Candidatus Thermoplasmatota archaeon]|nr:PKD domain-containing protein [Candidatus Thermoplasmatota archaeon]
MSHRPVGPQAGIALLLAALIVAPTLGSASTTFSPPEEPTYTEYVFVHASFTFAPTTPAAGEPVTFTDTSTARTLNGTPAPHAIVGWRWTFGDGNTSTEQHPTHTFTDPRRFSVKLEVTDSSGHTWWAFNTVRVVGTEDLSLRFLAVLPDGTAPNLDTNRTALSFVNIASDYRVFKWFGETTPRDGGLDLTVPAGQWSRGDYFYAGLWLDEYKTDGRILGPLPGPGAAPLLFVLEAPLFLRLDPVEEAQPGPLAGLATLAGVTPTGTTYTDPLTSIRVLATVTWANGVPVAGVQLMHNDTWTGPDGTRHVVDGEPGLTGPDGTAVLTVARPASALGDPSPYAFGEHETRVRADLPDSTADRFNRARAPTFRFTVDPTGGLLGVAP